MSFSIPVAAEGLFEDTRFSRAVVLLILEMGIYMAITVPIYLYIGWLKTHS